jgi:hypothetical protein
VISDWMKKSLALILLSLAEVPLRSPSENSSVEVPINDIIAHYKFDGNGSDSCGISYPFQLSNTKFIEKTLYLNGYYEHGGENGYRAVAKVPRLNYNSFTVSLEFKPISPSRRRNIFTHLFNLSYDETGNIITGGTSYRWFSLRRNENEALELTLNNQDFIHTYEGVHLNTKMWNSITCCVDLDNSLIRMFLNGKKLDDVLLPPDFVLRVLSSGSRESDKELTFTNYSDGNVVMGYVDNLRIFDGALEDDHVFAISFEHLLNRTDWDTMIIWIILAICFVSLGLLFYLKNKKLKRLKILSALC